MYVDGEEREKKVKSGTTNHPLLSWLGFEQDVGKRKNNSSTVACFSETTDCFHYRIFHFRPHITTNEHIFLHTVDIVVAVYTTTSALVVYKATATVCTPNAPLGLHCHASCLVCFPLYLGLYSLTHSLTHWLACLLTQSLMLLLQRLP